MPAKKKKCERCGREFYACRSDSKWCSERCRYRERMENAKFELPTLPKSGIPGIVYHRIRKRWDIRIPEDKHHPKYNWKYIGTAVNLSDAVKMQNEILGKQSVLCERLP